MKAHGSILLIGTLLATATTGAACMGGTEGADADTHVCDTDSVAIDSLASDSLAQALLTDTTDWETRLQKLAELDEATRYTSLTNEDFNIVAQELGVEVAAIKAVVRIEAGASLEGFFAPGVPVINFDRSMYNKARPTSNAKAPASAKVPDGIKSAYGRKEWSQLIQARKSNIEKADMGTFWGMFQIGGFNYKLCGCKSVQEFVDRMSFSEFEQLQLFANFIKNSGMLTDLRNKNWAAFARKYNGASYAARGYHTRMAKEYAKYKAQEK